MKTANETPSEITDRDLVAAQDAARARLALQGEPGDANDGPPTRGRAARRILRDTPRDLGQPGERTCGYCGSVVRKVRRELASWVHVWVWDHHDCPEGIAARAERARVLAEKHAAEERERKR